MDQNKTPQIFEEWCRGEYTTVLTAVTLLCGDKHIAEDATHDAFVRAFQKWGDVSQMASPTGWTIKVAHNLIRRSFKRRRTIATDPSLMFQSGTVDQTGSLAAHIDTWKAVASLSPRQRLAVVLKYVDGRTQADISNEMSVSPGTTAATLNQARTNLRNSEHLTSEESWQ